MTKNLSLEKTIGIQKNLEHVLDNLREGIIAHDLQRRIFFFNREAERITGYTREEATGRDCHDVFGRPLCGDRCSFCGEKPLLSDHTTYPITILSKSGETRRVDMAVTMMRDENDRFIGVLASLNDVTDLLDFKIRAAKPRKFSNIIGQDAKMLQVFQQIIDVAGYDYPVHISGETGTGKEMVAAAIHSESRRSGGPFVPINCGALPEGLIESELFGHVKGAFSGAIRDKKGRFELANGGTLFLDEVSELSKYMQVRLLRVLQDGLFERVGGEKTLSVNIRIISATNKDLKKEILKNNFREDLYYRLNVFPICLPPLCERKNDIPLLIDHFLKNHSESHGNKPYGISKKALSLMMDYHWPGNVRELQNAVWFSIVKCKGKILSAEHLPIEVLGYKNLHSSPKPSRKLEPETVLSALEKTGGNKIKAAKLLGVGRATLYRFMNNHPDLLRE